MEGIVEKKALKLQWQIIGSMVSEESRDIFGICSQCKALVVEEEYWDAGFIDYRLPLPKLCQLLEYLQIPPEVWAEVLPTEGETDTAYLGMTLSEKLLERHLRITWEHHLIMKEGLWLVGVQDIQK